MWRIYLRIFILITAVTFSLTQVLSYLTNQFYAEQIEQFSIKDANAQIFLVEQYLDNSVGQLWLSRFKNLQKKSNHSYELIPLERAKALISPRNLQRLLDRKVVVDFRSEAYFRRVDTDNSTFSGSSNQVIYVTDKEDRDPIITKIKRFQYSIIFLLLLLICGIWAHLHWRELQSLSKTANEFGSGLLSSRAKARKSAIVYPLAQCMNLMADRTQRLIDSQRELLHSVSHELRTPIARLEFGLELLKNDANNKQLEPRFTSMENDLHELNDLVSELLSLAKIEQQQALPMQSVNTAEALHQVINSLSHLLQEKEMSHSLHSETSTISGDPKLLMRALSNLLRNAAKYANQKIRISTLSNASGGVDIRIEDDGPGVPANEREHIFEPFYRLDRSRDRASGGFGLGLAIAKKAVTLHKGRIWVDQSDLGGARFTISLSSSA
ncbi:ATP-binding protein [Iodobacter fluviatilis]|uniref:histidine kinase n=1 Tax=Iodobacter fluviatilis TaxID=537 RepID=A0A377Q7R6_9NEIS|nr:ATP-binding protein [Iodobacter fluviatilis]TCU89430.1 two-component system OmpR family sensor kinase [Iodobacter fluviatilis]STQ90800.1 Sensor protein RstB [Iodobacter fluviatilis]